jgi:hypothetical protein
VTPTEPPDDVDVSGAGRALYRSRLASVLPMI